MFFLSPSHPFFSCAHGPGRFYFIFRVTLTAEHSPFVLHDWHREKFSSFFFCAVCVRSVRDKPPPVCVCCLCVPVGHLRTRERSAVHFVLCVFFRVLCFCVFVVSCLLSYALVVALLPPRNEYLRPIIEDDVATGTTVLLGVVAFWRQCRQKKCVILNSIPEYLVALTPWVACDYALMCLPEHVRTVVPWWFLGPLRALACVGVADFSCLSAHVDKIEVGTFSRRVDWKAPRTLQVCG